MTSAVPGAVRRHLGGATRVLVVGAVGAGLVLGAGRLDGSLALDGSGSASPPAPSRSPVTGTTLVCPGEELSGVEAIDDVPLPGVLAASSPPATLLEDVVGPLPDAGSVRVRPLGGGKARAATKDPGGSVTVDYDSPAPLAVTGTGRLAPGLVASQEWESVTSTFRGIGSSACGPAVADAWFLVGGGAPGRQERLVLGNPGANVVTVDVTMLGRRGEVRTAAGQDVVVGPGERRTVLLDSISGSERSPAVHVTTEGGLVHAAVNDTWLDGTTPAGSDDAPPAAAPSRRQVVPAVPTIGSAWARVAVPGRAEVVAQVRLLTGDGRVALDTKGVVRIKGGHVADIPLGDLPSDVVAVEVEADHPVVVGVRAVVPGPRGKRGEFAWTASASPVDGLAGAALASPVEDDADLARVLAVTAVGGKRTVDVVTVDGKGDDTTKEVTVDANTTTSVDVSGAASVWVRPTGGDGDVVAGVVTTLGSESTPLLTAQPLSRPALTKADVRVTQMP